MHPIKLMLPDGGVLLYSGHLMSISYKLINSSSYKFLYPSLIEFKSRKITLIT